MLILKFHTYLAPLVIYIHIFLLLRLLIKLLNRKSPLYVIFEVFISQLWMYLKSIVFMCLILACIISILLLLVNQPGEANPLSFIGTCARIIVLSFDKDWIFIVNELQTLVENTSEFKQVLTSTYLYLLQFFCQQILIRFFISVVMSSYQQSKAYNEFIFDEELTEKLLKDWLLFDPAGQGYIYAGDYIKFIIHLKPPLKLSPEDYQKQAGVIEKAMASTYPASYPFVGDESYPDFGLDTKGAGILPQGDYYKNEDGSIKLSVTQYFLLCRIYNVPIYIENKRVYVHFKDAIKALSRVAIESKYPDTKEMKYNSELIETMLIDKWVSAYPDLGTLIDKQNDLRFDKQGYERRSLDILDWVACSIITSNTLKNKETAAARLNIEQNKKLMMYREMEEDMNQKIIIFSEMGSAVMNRLAYEEILLKFKNNRQLRNPSKKLQGTPSPEISKSITTDLKVKPKQPKKQSIEINDPELFADKSASPSKRKIRKNDRHSLVFNFIPEKKVEQVRIQRIENFDDLELGRKEDLPNESSIEISQDQIPLESFENSFS